MSNNVLERTLYKDALHKWGLSSQLDMLVEECGELIVAVQKLHRYGKTAKRVDAVLEELADVSIMIGQMTLTDALALTGEAAYNVKREQKLNRLRETIANWREDVR